MNALSWKNSEGMQIHAAEWPVENPRAVIALVHGQSEHIGRYRHLAEWFNAHGVALVGFDQQGYGKSDGKRGHVRSLEVLLDDIGQLLEETENRYRGIPLFLYGHSMGGNLALNFALRRAPALSGIIATGPWIRLAFPAPGLKILAAKVLKKITPALTLPTGLAAHFLSRDEKVVKAYQDDPLVHGQLSVIAGLELLEGASWLDRFSGTVESPLLLMHGGGDKITSAEATKAFSDRVSGEVTHREWDDLYHEIHNEAEQDQVFEYILSWMDHILAGRPA
ncbi:MAG: lysophospholipase [Saprospiraceae bacterium]|nr:lysophospholipase [Saprospiraceae bacterium]